MPNNFKELIKKATKKITMMNRTEREAGFMPDEEGPISSRLRTVELALEAGLKTEGWNAIAEAYVMLCAINKNINAENN